MRILPRRPVRAVLIPACGLALLAPVGPVFAADPEPGRSYLAEAGPDAPGRAGRDVADVRRAAWTGTELREGRFRHTRLAKGEVVLTSDAPTRRRQGRRVQVGTWTSPRTANSFGFTEAIASWSASTPGASYVEIRIRGWDAQGRRSSWDRLGRWTSTMGPVRRTTFDAQSDDLASVAVDTWRVADAAGLDDWQVRVTLVGRADTRRPALRSLSAMVSRLPTTLPSTSRPGVAAGRSLPVPRYSQMIHRGDSPEYGGGGQAWCSPTSTSMVLGYYDALPPPASYRWLPDGHPDPWVDEVARRTFDHGYDGTGNWPFNTAYASARTSQANYVTRLQDLRRAERFIVAGIPLIASISFGAGELDGSPIGATNGHLVVIRGFTRHGDVIVNDPAAPTNATVRRVYDRAQFERVWLRGSGGLVYVIHDADHEPPMTQERARVS